MMRQLRGDWQNLLSMHQFHVNPATIPNSTRGNDVARVVGLRGRAAALRLAHSHADKRRTPLYARFAQSSRQIRNELK